MQTKVIEPDFETFSGPGHRDTMEDCALVQTTTRGRLIIMCDGHGPKGADVATHIMARLAAGEECFMSAQESEFFDLAAEAFEVVHVALKGDPKRDQMSGAAVLIARLIGSRALIAYAGDVEARLVSEHGWDHSRSLTPPHTLRNTSEVRRLCERHQLSQITHREGGHSYLTHKERLLQITRGVGTAHFDEVGHTCAADIAYADIGPKDLLVIGTDGMWEVMDRCRLAQRKWFDSGDPQSGAAFFKDRCVRAYRTRGYPLDNFACVVAGAA